MLRYLREYLHKRLFRENAHRAGSPRYFVGLDKASKAGILFMADDEESIKIVLGFREFLESKGVRTKLLGYSERPDGDGGTTHDSYSVFTARHLDFRLRPRHILANDFMREEFDILLNMYPGECLPLQYVSALSRAHMRVGAYRKNNLYCNDFLIHVNHNSLTEFADSAKHYLSQKALLNEAV